MERGLRFRIFSIRFRVGEISQDGSDRSGDIIHISKLYALAHPSIAFSLIEGGRTLFRSPACEGFAERVRETLGKGLAECLAPIEFSEPGLSLED